MGKTTSDPPFFARPGGDAGDLAEALKESRGLLALAEQSAGIGIWDTDLATDIVRATPTFFQLMGLPVTAEPIANDIVRAVRHPTMRRGCSRASATPWHAESIPTRSSTG
jgi:PAS domain-containing protein